MLPGTIRQNLMPWLLNDPEATSDQCSTSTIKQVLEDTMLADKVAVECLDTSVDELGFSAGERQLFSVARSMLLNLWNGRRIVLMDEASSNVDVETDEKLHLAIGRAFQGRTVCSITHRLETVKKAQVIYELDNGVMSVHAGRESSSAESMDAGTK